ncbi:MAG TPA: LytR C-terminal domain-containing protein [Candidatus Nanopelagicales bacterium]|nr:LytR C-terminal domain-containing protein [Candidatus Nanopelagicales bacterium]
MSLAPGDPAPPDPDHVDTVTVRRKADPPPPRWPIPPLAFALVLALVAGLTVAGAWQTLQHRSATRSAGAATPAAAGSPAGDAAQPVASDAAARRAADAEAAAAKAAKAQAAARARARAKAKRAKERAEARAAASSVVRDVDVVVLNATNRTGLAAGVAAKLREQGWTVVSVANWRGGGVPETSVFTSGGAAAAVRTLQRDVPSADQVRSPLPGMSTGRLVLVLAADYPG